MITIISGTNRKGSATRTIANYYHEKLQTATKETVKLYALEDLPSDFYHNGMYSADGQNAALGAVQDEFMLSSNKFVIISPEYNGSYPGILKLFLDACSIREYKATFMGKKVGLVGVASGRAGNLRGLDHLTGIFNHVGSQVMPQKLPISGVGALIADGVLINEATQESIANHIANLLAF